MTPQKLITSLRSRLGRAYHQISSLQTKYYEANQAWFAQERQVRRLEQKIAFLEAKLNPLPGFSTPEWEEPQKEPVVMDRFEAEKA
jgi:hypothetical protein